MRRVKRWFMRWLSSRGSFQARGVTERGAIGASACIASARWVIVRPATGCRCRSVAAPFPGRRAAIAQRCATEPPNEGHRKAERQAVCIETRQHDSPPGASRRSACRELPSRRSHRRCSGSRGARHCRDARLIARRPVHPLGRFPRPQAAPPPAANTNRATTVQRRMSDDQVGQHLADDRMLRRGRQSQQHAAFAQRRINRHPRNRRNHQPRCRAAEQAAHLAEARGPRHQNRLADPMLQIRAARHDLPNRFVARDQRYPIPRKRRHPALPQQAFGSGPDAPSRRYRRPHPIARGLRQVG